MKQEQLPKERVPGRDPAGLFAPRSDAFGDLMQKVYQVAAKRGLTVQELGKIDNDPLLLLTPSVLREGPKLLVAAGFHGDEPGGCRGIIRFLENVEPTLFQALNLSFLPLVNPTGFRLGQRTNEWGEDPNRGLVHHESDRGPSEPLPSREGAILLQHLPLLKSLAADAFLSLHEDVEYGQFYLYAFENADKPGPFSKDLRAEATKFFSLFPDGPLEGGVVHDGIIFKYHDGSFEDLLFHSGVSRTASTETPGLAELEKRVEANAALVTALARYALTR